MPKTISREDLYSSILHDKAPILLEALPEKYYLEALRIEPTYWPALKGLGRTYVARGKAAQAVAALTMKH